MTGIMRSVPVARDSIPANFLRMPSTIVWADRVKCTNRRLSTPSPSPSDPSYEVRPRTSVGSSPVRPSLCVPVLPVLVSASASSFGFALFACAASRAGVNGPNSTSFWSTTMIRGSPTSGSVRRVAGVVGPDVSSSTTLPRRTPRRLGSSPSVALSLESKPCVPSTLSSLPCSSLLPLLASFVVGPPPSDGGTGPDGCIPDMALWMCLAASTICFAWSVSV